MTIDGHYTVWYNARPVFNPLSSGTRACVMRGYEVIGANHFIGPRSIARAEQKQADWIKKTNNPSIVR